MPQGENVVGDQYPCLECFGETGHFVFCSKFPAALAEMRRERDTLTADDFARQRDIILTTAAGLISGDREALYGSAADGFARTGKLWAAILGLDVVTAEQVALCLTALKISRLCETPGHFDSWVDAAGYVALGGEIATTALD